MTAGRAPRSEPDVSHRPLKARPGGEIGSVHPPPALRSRDGRRAVPARGL